ncbi:MAG TPA: DUF6644 family protein [Gemmatimonadaceae bacterium]|jgi:hypothetical protein|nr:DUF6644 family protein [Gemmatimonadaceae bacterium]
MIAPPSSIVDLLKPWNDFYSHSKTTETIVQFLHVGGLLLAGGLAIAADRGTLRALRIAASDRTHYTKELGSIHRWVLTGLFVVVLSGLALLASDLETFWGSAIFWIKMALVVILLVNGLFMTRAEAALRRDTSESSPAWRSLHRTAVSSLVLWFIITALGLALVNFS